MTVSDPAPASVPHTPRRGRLTIYLGAAPGVGKTYAMLDEAHRRLARGTDVVVGFVETHGRPLTIKHLQGLEIVPRKTMSHRGAEFTEMDTEAVIARKPAVVLVDELAHTNVPGSRHEKRAQDVEDIRAAGIDVITTVNIQHLESLNDEVERITGVRQRETVPDDVVRTADQIQLVDMSPEALRRRLAHGNVYRAEQIDASLSSYFRVGNLTALRELALLWLADRVDDALDDYRRAHRIEAPWPARERVVVAVTGGPESETLIRRGARIAQRAAGSELMAVHVISSDGLASRDDVRVSRAHQLVEQLGGSFHSVVGEDVADAVVDFATGVNATMIVVGLSRHGRLRQLFTGATGPGIAALAGSIDVHLVTHDQAERRVRTRARRSALAPRRLLAGWLAAFLLPALLTIVLMVTKDVHSLPTEVMFYLAIAVAVALIGGRAPAIAAAVVGFLMLNWYFTPPVGRWTVADPENLVALLVFVAVAVAVATVVDSASRRALDATRARAEAATLAQLSQSILTGQDTAEAVTEQLRESFSLDSVALLARREGHWAVVASSGPEPATHPEEADTRVTVDDDRVLALRGGRLRASDQRVLEGFAVTTGLVLEYRRLRERDARAQALERAEATSTAVLRAVSHDLRTPLATMRTAVEGLASPGLDDADRAELTETLVVATDQLEHLIDDLLDLSRLESGLLKPVMRDLGLDEVLPLAIAGYPRDRVVLEADESTPLVHTDGGLLERVVANLVGNAVRHAPAGEPVRLQAHVHPDEVTVRVVDRGPGVPPELRARMFDPFQRLGDTGGTGLGLGLAVAQGLAEAIGATVTVEDTPGGGLTMAVSLPRADAPGTGTGA
ncbi:sensor histidine kinase KdpD [Nocardioides guangzhouensis]|uniref:histidine kinase n=1 Tax=Nocardioides guangzhouensis TaxID=2497878 RepID=A0A4Q4Z9H9_9ACTN|nr:ATP-binding protein [Nocardioides guangzhouensis]RYP83724.1 sensor histidine kinase KdpD [Nocardioides guangzhouensis]